MKPDGHLDDREWRAENARSKRKENARLLRAVVDLIERGEVCWVPERNNIGTHSSISLPEARRMAEILRHNAEHLEAC